MQISVTKQFTFDAAHHLTKYYGKCERVHGHTYKLSVTVSGKLDANDMLLDFIILKRVVKKHILDKLDHQDLNTIFPNPTTETVATWIWNSLQNLPELLTQELADPNLGEEIKKYLSSPNDQPLTESDFKIRLSKITLHETDSSFVTITA